MASGEGTSASAASIAERVRALGEWVTGFTVEGVSYGGHYRPENDDRVWKFVERLRASNATPENILECGCLEGGHTVTIAREFPSAKVHAVDVRNDNLAKARLLTELMQCANVALLQDDFDEPGTCFERTYDAVFCVGLLYHLAKPREFLKLACEAAPFLWLWTVYCAEEEVAKSEATSRGRIYRESVEHPLSAVRKESYLPSLGSLVEFLWEAGYTRVELIRKEMTANGNGPAVLLCATR